MIQGVDVSVWQGAIDWPKLAMGARFAFIRMSYGTYVDETAVYNWAQAKVAGIPRGAYHYFYRDVDPVQQATAFLQSIAGDYGELPCVVDVEDTTEPNSTWTQAQCDALRAFLGIVENTARRAPIIYTGFWYWTPKLPLAPWAGAYDLWVAQYSGDAPAIHSPWTAWRFWQLSSTGRGHDYGAASDVIDLDIFNGDEAAWNAYLQGTIKK